MNRYPRWVNVLVLAVMLAGILLALPNLFGDDVALHVSRADGQPVEEALLPQLRSTLVANGIEPLAIERDGDAALIRFAEYADQQEGNAIIRETYDTYTVALTLAPRIPGWLAALGLKPMSLGLDLRGGVHFLFQVDVDGAIQQLLRNYETTLRSEFREADIRSGAGGPRVDGETLLVPVANAEDMDRAEKIIQDLDTSSQLTSRLIVERTTIDGQAAFRVGLTETLLRERQDFAIQQNTVTIRNRVNALGVSEPVVQRQGLDRILVQLPGVQDPSQAERILDATATLEYRLVDYENDPIEAERRGRPPLGSELYYDEAGNPVLVRREVIATGDQVTDATFGYDQNGLPAVFVDLNAQGARRMLDNTTENLGRNMAVLFIEERLDVVEHDGEQVIERNTERRIISNARINGVFSNRFMTTGLSLFEARDLALLLRAGALATPIVKIEERTIGPSLGADNIRKGRLAIVVGFLLVVLFMAAYYRVFGLVANLALSANVVLIVAILSVSPAALTLPGIAGIVLTIGMAVDANVLIFERIREELRNGNSPQSSIRAGYDKAFSTIADANITTLIAAIVLFAYGTGPIKGFAVTLMIGIITSMFTAIVGTRVVINLIYGGRQAIKRLSIGGSASRAAA